MDAKDERKKQQETNRLIGETIKKISYGLATAVVAIGVIAWGFAPGSAEGAAEMPVWWGTAITTAWGLVALIWFIGWYVGRD